MIFFGKPVSTRRVKPRACFFGSCSSAVAFAAIGPTSVREHLN
jgi:hypothetical protein